MSRLELVVQRDCSHVPCHERSRCALTERARSIDVCGATRYMTDGIDASGFLKGTCELPSAMRGEMFREMRRTVLSDSLLFRGVSTGCVSRLLAELVPQAVVKKAVLIKANDLCVEVFILLKGSLNVIVDPRAPGAGSTDSPVGRQASKKKITSNFRVVERPGALVGMYSPYHMPWRAPFTVTALKLSHVLGLRADAMNTVLAQFSDTDDQSKILSSLEAAFTQVAGQNAVRAQQEAQHQQKKEAKSLMASSGGGATPSTDEALFARELVNVFEESDEALSTEIMTKVQAIGTDLDKCTQNLRKVAKTSEKIPAMCASSCPRGRLPI